MRYFVNSNAQSNGDHEVHTADCSYLPSPSNLQFLGDFATCREAVAAARRYHNQVNGCYWCSNACHTS